MADVFISYSHKDSHYAYKIASELARYDIDVWMDGRIDYGTKWPHVIEKNLNDCPVFIILLSTNSKNSDWVLNELTYAQGKKKIIFPLLYEGENWLQLATTQYVDVRKGELPPNEYFKTIQRRLSEISEERYLLKQIILKLSDAVKKKKERNWEIGILKIQYSLGNDKHPSFSYSIADKDLLCYYDVTYRTRGITFKISSILKNFGLPPIPDVEYIQSLTEFHGLNQGYETEPTDYEIQKYAAQIIKNHKDHFVPLNKINIKVIE